MDLRFRFQLRNMIFVKHLGIEKQTTDQGTLAVVDASTSNESKQLLSLMLCQVFVNVRRNQVALVAHFCGGLIET